MEGYRFEKISEIIGLSVLPPLLWSRKAYQGSSSDSSVTANELLIVHGIKSRLLFGRKQLKVYSLTHKKEKTLSGKCVGRFSTKPQDIALYLTELTKYLPEVFPCRAVMDPLGDPQGKTHQTSIVTLLHTFVESSLVVTSVFEETSQAKELNIPIDLGILVKVDHDYSTHLHEESDYELVAAPNPPSIRTTLSTSTPTQADKFFY